MKSRDVERERKLCSCPAASLLLVWDLLMWHFSSGASSFSILKQQTPIKKDDRLFSSSKSQRGRNQKLHWGFLGDGKEDHEYGGTGIALLPLPGFTCRCCLSPCFRLRPDGTWSDLSIIISIYKKHVKCRAKVYLWTMLCLSPALHCFHFSLLHMFFWLFQFWLLLLTFSLWLFHFRLSFWLFDFWLFTNCTF